MAVSWTLVPCLVTLREEFNRLAPNRGKASDGSVGDTSHAASSSDHNPDETGRTPTEDADQVNEVHAIDVTANLREPGWSMDRCVEIIVTRHREGRDDRLQNVIYNRRIWSRSWGWTARAYTGPNPHDKHAHFGARYTTAQENDTSPWGLLEEDDVALDSSDLAAIEKIVAEYVGDVVQRFGADGKPVPSTDKNQKMTVASALGFVGRDMALVKQGLTALTAAVAKGSTLTAADLTAALAAAAPAVAVAVVSMLPEDRDDVTVDELTAAVVAAFEDLATRPQA